MIRQKQRKEIALDEQTIALLQVQAEREGRKLKNYLEQVLKEKANSIEVSDEYKAMMDTMLERHSKGEVKYSSWEEVKSKLSKK